MTEAIFFVGGAVFGMGAVVVAVLTAVSFQSAVLDENGISAGKR
jgi:hypothetical protein